MIHGSDVCGEGPSCLNDRTWINSAEPSTRRIKPKRGGSWRVSRGCCCGMMRPRGRRDPLPFVSPLPPSRRGNESRAAPKNAMTVGHDRLERQLPALDDPRDSREAVPSYEAAADRELLLDDLLQRHLGLGKLVVSELEDRPGEAHKLQCRHQKRPDRLYDGVGPLPGFIAHDPRKVFARGIDHQRRAVLRREVSPEGEGSETIAFEAPDAATRAVNRQPIGPAPSTTTESPGRMPSLPTEPIAYARGSASAARWRAAPSLQLLPPARSSPSSAPFEKERAI